MKWIAIIGLLMINVGSWAQNVVNPKNLRDLEALKVNADRIKKIDAVLRAYIYSSYRTVSPADFGKIVDMRAKDCEVFTKPCLEISTWAEAYCPRMSEDNYFRLDGLWSSVLKSAKTLEQKNTLIKAIQSCTPRPTLNQLAVGLLAYRILGPQMNDKGAQLNQWMLRTFAQSPSTISEAMGFGSSLLAAALKSPPWDSVPMRTLVTLSLGWAAAQPAEALAVKNIKPWFQAMVPTAAQIGARQVVPPVVEAFMGQTELIKKKPELMDIAIPNYCGAVRSLSEPGKCASMIEKARSVASTSILDLEVGKTHMFQGRYKEAEAIFAKLKPEPVDGQEKFSRYLRYGMLAAAEGKWDLADQNVAVAEGALVGQRRPTPLAMLGSLRIKILRDRGQFAKSLAEADRFRAELETRVRGPYYGKVLVNHEALLSSLAGSSSRLAADIKALEDSLIDDKGYDSQREVIALAKRRLAEPKAPIDFSTLSKMVNKSGPWFLDVQAAFGKSAPKT